MSTTCRKSLLWMFLTLLVAITVEIPGAANAGSTTLYVDPPGIADLDLTPGNETHPTTFDVNITVADVEDLWGYQFVLDYNTTVLTATSYESYAPFGQKLAATINDTSGRVALAYTMPFGTGEGEGKYGTVPLAKITFTVDALGVTILDLSETKVTNPTDPSGIPHQVKDGMFTNVEVHDIAITGFTASPKRVEPGDLISINVTVANKGDFRETLNASVYYYLNATHTMLLGEENLLLLGSGENTTISLTWNTTDVANDEYILNVNATIDVDHFPADNVKGDVRVRIGVTRDIAIVDATANPTHPAVIEPVVIHVKIGNLGDFTETFNVSASYDGTVIGTQTVETLLKGASRAVDVVWRTEDVAEGNYTLTVEVFASVDDDDLTNNIFGDIKVTVGMLGPPVVLYYWVGTIAALIVGVSVVYTVRSRSRKFRPR